MNVPAPRKRDDIWDALAEAMPQPLTTSERGRWNRAVKELRDAGLGGDEVARACSAYREMWPNLSMTPTAIAANVSTLLGPAPTPSGLERYQRLARVDYDADHGIGFDR